jgi:4a-hydroxytetrahydrobiopterin dehydratase
VGIPPLTPEEAERFRQQVSQWELRDDAKRIERTLKFRNFREALSFVQQVGELAEREDHHPDVCFDWGYVTVSLRTRKIKGLHENDFILAAKIDRLFDRAEAEHENRRAVSRRGKQNDGRERDKRLDEALEMTFPASDPIAVGRATGAEVAQGAKVARAARKGASPAAKQ